MEEPFEGMMPRLWQLTMHTHPERESRETLQKIRETIGDYNFQSQYQQRPIPPEGGMIKREWLRYYEPEERPRRFPHILQSWDTANNSGEFND
jgi:hypothetical protein